MTAINWSNITDFAQIPGAANTASDGSFWVGMLYMVWVILILLLLAFGWEVALVVASFVGLILAVLLVYAELIAWEWATTFVGILLFMFLYIIWSSKKTRT